MTTNNALNNSANGSLLVTRTDVPSSAYIPTLTAIANAGSLANIRSLYYAIGVQTNNVCVITSKFTVVPTAISFVTAISIPVGANFPSDGKAQLVMGNIYDTGTNAIIGNVIDADSASGDSVRIQFAVSPSALNISNTVNVTVGYIIQ